MQYIFVVEHLKSASLACECAFPERWTEFDMGGRAVLVGCTENRAKETEETRLYIHCPGTLPPACLCEDIWVVMVLFRRIKSGRKRLFFPEVLILENAAIFTGLSDHDRMYLSMPFKDELSACQAADGIVEVALRRFLAIRDNALTDLMPAYRRMFAHLVPQPA